ncbi:hypothetical protein ACLB2K_072346 [Fragaria x ananassa]
MRNIRVPPSTPPQCSPHFVPNLAAVHIIDAFAGFRQGMDECFKDFRADLCKVQERLRECGRLIQELRLKVSSAATTLGPRYAPEDPTLPHPWRGLIDGSTGSLYYWNTATNQTQYERPCPQAQKTHPTQPISLLRKQIRGLRDHVSMAATRRLVKDTRKPDLLSSVGKYSRSKLNRKHGLWALKAQHGEVFSEIMEAIHQHCVGTETSTTNPSFSPQMPDVPEQQEASLGSPEPKSDAAMLSEGSTTDASLASATALGPEPSDSTAPTLTLQLMSFH